MARKGKQRKAHFGVLFWMVFILFVVVLYLYHREDIRQVVDRTGIADVITERISPDRAADDGDQPDDSGEPRPEPDPNDIPDTRGPDGSDPDHPPIDRDDSDEPGTEDREPSEPADPEGEAEADARDEDYDASAEPAPESDPEHRERRYGIYFIRVTDEGQIYAERVERRVRFTDSPMTATIRELMRGPTLEELDSGFLNLIPDDAELISAWVRDGTAYLNFSESFQFNTMGVEGLVAQLKQIVYSTTEFPTVDRVQILIEGERIRYLGGAGVYVGEPLQRESFG